MMVHLNNQSFLFGNNKCWNITVTCLSSRYKRTLWKMKGSSVCRSQPRGSVSQEIQHKLFTQTDLWPAGPLWPTAHQPRCCNHDKASRLLFCLEENQTKQKKNERSNWADSAVIYSALSRGLSSRPLESRLRHTVLPLASRSSRRSSEEAAGVVRVVGGHGAR